MKAEKHPVSVRVFPRTGLSLRLPIFLVWLVVALYLAAHHVMWRDEVRAYSLALTPGSVFDMLRAVHGEGHPALWYLMLRAAHTIVPAPQVMPVIAFAVGAAAALLFALRAPFGWPMIALVLAGRFALYEYTVMARNYGISMLLMFAIAALYRRHRDNGWVLGGLLLLLCNTNAHSVVLAAAFVLFWMIDVAGDEPIGWTRPWKGFLIGAAMAAIGALACALEVYPPFNDAAVASPPTGLPVIAPFKIGRNFSYFIPIEIRDVARKIVVPVVLLGSLLRLVRSPGALLASLVAILGLSALFSFVYGGVYRHEALAIVFLLMMNWLVAEGSGGRWPHDLRQRIGAARWPRAIGTVALTGLLALQAVQSVALVTRARRGMPESRSSELAGLLRRPALRDAIVIGDPDYNLEALPYYVPNQTYFVREHRFGRYTIFSKAADHPVSLGDILNAGLMLHAQTGKPIVVVLGEPLHRTNLPGRKDRSFYGDAVQTADQIARFHAIARPIASFDHITGGDESYDVYVIDGPQPAAYSAPAN